MLLYCELGFVSATGTSLSSGWGGWWEAEEAKPLCSLAGIQAGIEGGSAVRFSSRAGLLLRHSRSQGFLQDLRRELWEGALLAFPPTLCLF